jgi:hypothetical protein
MKLKVTRDSVAMSDDIDALRNRCLLEHDLLAVRKR